MNVAAAAPKECGSSRKNRKKNAHRGVRFFLVVWDSKKERERQERGKEKREKREKKRQQKKQKDIPKNNTLFSLSHKSHKSHHRRSLLFFFSAHTHTPFVVCFGILLLVIFPPRTQKHKTRAQTNAPIDRTLRRLE